MMLWQLWRAARWLRRRQSFDDGRGVDMTAPRATPILDLLAEAGAIISQSEDRFLAAIEAAQPPEVSVERYLDLFAMAIGVRSHELSVLFARLDATSLFTELEPWVGGDLACEITAFDQFRRGLLTGALVARDRSGLL